MDSEVDYEELVAEKLAEKTAKIERLREQLAEARAEIDRLRDVITDMECSCLPHARPGDGECQRCAALRGGEGEKDEALECPGFRQNTRGGAALDQCHHCGNRRDQHLDGEGDDAS